MTPHSEPRSTTHQALLYFLFAVIAAIVNLIVQYIHMEFVSGIICKNISSGFLQQFYCPVDGRVLVGAALGVGISYLLKFVLDKFIVFQRSDTDLKQTSREFLKYFAFAILVTVVIGIGGQYLLYKGFGVNYILAGALVLTIGYSVKFLLDRRYVFVNEVVSEKLRADNQISLGNEEI